MIDLKYIPENTYKYARLDVYKLSGKEKHGINAADIRAYSEDFSFDLNDIEMDYEVEVSERWMPKEQIEFKKSDFDSFVTFDIEHSGTNGIAFEIHFLIPTSMQSNSRTK